MNATLRCDGIMFVLGTTNATVIYQEKFAEQHVEVHRKARL
jgi:hypothetical protein